MGRKPTSDWIAGLALAAALVSGGCQRSAYYSLKPASSGGSTAAGVQLASGNGNGEGYQGQISRYIHLDPAHPCSDLGADGKPLPNQEIILSGSASGQTAQLARSGCSTLNPPQPLNFSDLQFATDGSGDLIYQGSVFVPAPPPSPSTPPATLSLDFTTAATLPTALSLSRSTPATFTDSTGTLATAPAGTARFDYDPLTHQPRGLLMESGATNLLLSSEVFGNTASWATHDASVASNAGAAPDGTAHAAFIREDTVSTFHSMGQNLSSAYSSGSPLTFSVFAKAGTRMRLDLMIQDSVAFSDQLSASFNLSSGATDWAKASGSASGLTTSTIAYPNGWYRLILSGIPSAQYSSLQLDFFLDTGPSSNYPGDGSSGVYLWGAQLEAGLTASTYILTTSAPAARAADSAQFKDLSWYSPGPGTLFAEFIDLGNESSAAYAVFGLFGANDGTFSQNQIALSDQGASNMSSVTSGGSIVFAPGGNLNSIGVLNKQALAYATDGFSYSANGAATMDAGSGSLPANAAYSYLGSQPDGKTRSRYLRKIQYYNSRLPDVALQQLTQ